MTLQLGGVLTALATPFTADGALDVARLRAVVDRSIAGGVHGVVACGSTGEFTALSSDERRLVVETVVDQAAGRVPVVAQTGATSTVEAIALSRHAQSVGAEVVMLVAPYYEPLSVDETLTYLRTVAGSVDMPVMLYNLPVATGVDLDPDTVGMLAREVENIRYIKNTTVDMDQSARLIHNHGDVISTFVGWDSLLLSALSEGAAGVMAGTANVVPSELVAVYDAVSAGDLERARKTWSQIYPLIEAIMAQPFIAAVKAGMAAVGFPVGAPRPPVAELDPAAAARIAHLAKTATMETMATATTATMMGISTETGRPAVRRVRTGGILREGDLPPGGHFIDGAFRPGRSGTSIDVVDPSTGATIARVAEGTAEDTDIAVAAAYAVKDAWGGLTPKERSELLHRVADRVAEHADLLARLESANTGKPSAVAQDDVAQTVDTFRFMAGALRAPTSAAAGHYAEDHLSVMLREPLGVIGVVTPWNYPLLMGAWKMAPILAAGNTLVIKPSEQTPLTTLKFAELVADILPAGVVNVVTGYGPVVGTRLAEHPDVAMIALTGSVHSGKAVARAAAESLKRVHLELGGKAPVVIFEDADLAAAATALRAAGYWNSGQECGAACRVLVHESVADEFSRLLVDEVSSMVVGEPGAGDDVEIGPLTSKAHFDRVTGYLERARAEGVRAAVGGGPLEGDGYFVAPTVLVDVPGGAECAREEIFGPVVTVETFTDEDEVIRRANSVPYGLSASVWTKDAQRSHDVAGKLDAGTVWVNAHLVLASEVPWGGFKGSGYGRDLSIYALDDFSRTKHVMHNVAR
ncbi:aldehyde dehydrogenase family protein [Pseudonocardia sp. RS11V-5]|uniref:aldehyde dehydrogenase family protein n=1 Tax=Pseudonocardia terrae TaxID=2905831 RepID=UPI001E5B76E2|nr:aldehyde dehydrogenase family protein [Pseudonocardia terrae]MCE3552738.1 aldehyde dehydrogenase family protein [Pseudonocardia terrae]